MRCVRLQRRAAFELFRRQGLRMAARRIKKITRNAQKIAKNANVLLRLTLVEVGSPAAIHFMPDAQQKTAVLGRKEWGAPRGLVQHPVGRRQAGKRVLGKGRPLQDSDASDVHVSSFLRGCEIAGRGATLGRGAGGVMGEG